MQLVIHSPQSTIARRLLSLLCIAALSGCHDVRGTVSGSVALDGKRLSEGLVTFRPTPQTAGPEFSGVVANGEYRVPLPVLPGDYQVDVRSWQKTGRKVPGQFGEQIEETANVIPPRYSGPHTNLKAQVVTGENRFDFNLRR